MHSERAWRPRLSILLYTLVQFSVTVALVAVILVGPPPAASGQPLEQPSGSGAVPDLRSRTDGVDWPSFLGPGGDSKSPERGIITDWSTKRPPVMWVRDLGVSYGIGATSRGRYFQLDRYGDHITLLCLHAETGDELWRYAYPTEYEDLLGYNNGPRCSPVVDGDRVYAFGPDGMLCCVHVADGGELWRVDTTARYGVVQNFFGVGSTPVVEGDLLIVNVGGSPENSPHVYSGRVQGNGTGIVAFDKRTGEERYRLSDEVASYAAPVVATIGGRRWGLMFARGGLIGFEPREGRLDFFYPWRAPAVESVNASTPIVWDNYVFISETYGPGSSLLRIVDGRYEVVWTDEHKGRNKSMMTHWNTPIYHEGYIYGSSGRHANNAELRCVDAMDGRVMWSEPGLTRCSLLQVDGHFVCLGEDGVLRLVRVTPDAYDEVAVAVFEDEALGGDQPSARPSSLITYPAWAAPILSHGLLYVRGNRRLVCVELIPR